MSKSAELRELVDALNRVEAEQSHYPFHDRPPIEVTVAGRTYTSIPQIQGRIGRLQNALGYPG